MTEPAADHPVLRLYICGSTPRSTRAINNLSQFCAAFLAGRHDLEVIDIYQHPEASHADHIIAVPTLVRALPGPTRRLIGDLSDTARLHAMLDAASPVPAAH